MDNLREEILGEIEEAKARLGQRWYVWFGNFLLETASGRRHNDVDEFLRDNPERLNEIYSGSQEGSVLATKTQRQFIEDIDKAFRDAGTYDLLIERGELLSRAIESQMRDSRDDTECQLAETFIEPYIKLREMGYSREDLI
ncbi:hypothetical protein J4462_02655 [Candidatus Pacearchaeota archaeon]|nr:hypothetical protein [Candidatus Pacearchaeota archaeon]